MQGKYLCAEFTDIQAEYIKRGGSKRRTYLEWPDIGREYVYRKIWAKVPQDDVGALLVGSTDGLEEVRKLHRMMWDM